MKLTVTDKALFDGVRKAFEGRELFTLTGGGLTATMVADEVNYFPFGTPCKGSRPTVELSLTQVSIIPAAAVTWNGEGVPPVGLEVEIKLKSTRADWCPATVLFCQDDALVIAWKAEGVARPTTLSAVDIRPIRTAEQIAAEERDNGIIAIQKASSGEGLPPITYTHAAKLYNAGARMPGEGNKA